MYVRVKLPFYQYSGIRRNTLFTSRKAQLLRGSRLDGDIIEFYFHQMGQDFLHLGYTRFQFRAFGTDCRIYIAHLIAFGCNQINCFGQQNLTIYILKLTCRIGK